MRKFMKNIKKIFQSNSWVHNVHPTERTRDVLRRLQRWSGHSEDYEASTTFHFWSNKPLDEYRHDPFHSLLHISCHEWMTILSFSAIRTSLELTVNVARDYCRRLQPTDYEFLTILGLALWNDGLINDTNQAKIVFFFRNFESEQQNVEDGDAKSKTAHARTAYILYSARNCELCSQDWAYILRSSHFTGNTKW